MSNSIPKPTETQIDKTFYPRYYNIHGHLDSYVCEIYVKLFVDTREAWKFELFSILLSLDGLTANHVLYSFCYSRFWAAWTDDLLLL